VRTDNATPLAPVNNTRSHDSCLDRPTHRRLRTRGTRRSCAIRIRCPRAV